MGRGDACCIFLTLAADGFTCERFGRLHQTLVEKVPKTFIAQRVSAQPHPACMVFTDLPPAA